MVGSTSGNSRPVPFKDAAEFRQALRGALAADYGADLSDKDLENVAAGMDAFLRKFL